ncbi:MAG: hypothetical protein KDK69_03615, partial [Chlamydiia bacterium]|nr:hypothetical protein [Chlamydiia bacterium]
GWLWEFRPWISGGLAFRTKTYMTHFDKYKGVISPHGRADLPATFFGGIAVKPFVQTTIALDIGRIYNGNVDTFANSPYIFNATLTPVNPHGASNGAGFGWKSSTVYKIGIAQDIADSLTIRAGYNYGQLPWDVNIPNTNAVYGTWILPTTIRHHLTLGASLELGAQILNAAFVYGFKHSVHGPIHPIAGGGNLETSTDLITLQIGFSKVW